MYLTYEAYQNMGGTLDETTFNNYEYEAETIVYTGYQDSGFRGQ